MYFEQAIERINQINWKAFGHTKIEYSEKGSQYLIRMAQFIKENSFEPINPLVINVAELLGSKDRIELWDYCPVESVTALSRYNLVKDMLERYLELSRFSDIHEEYKKYLKIYEPLVELVELGIPYIYRDHGLMVYNSGLWPLHNWYEKFVNKIE